MHEEWKTALLEAKNAASRASSIRGFKGLHKEQAARASYFTELAKVIKSLGLSNPHEKSALTIEPAHPVQSRYLDRAFEKLNINPIIRERHKDCRLSLVSLEMLRRYSPESDARKMMESGFQSPLYLLDPLYGFVYLPRNGKIHNHCLAIDVWSSHLKSMPVQLSEGLWKNRADDMLSGGAFAGRLLLKDLIPPETDPIKLASPPVLVVNSESELGDLIKVLKDSASNLPGVELWFRGQSQDYQTPDRSILTQLNITPYSNVRDSDFTPSLYRKYDEFLDCESHYEGLVLELAEWVYYAKQIIPSGSQANINTQAAGVAAVNASGLESYQRGLILQQYGAPSAYLDITREHTIAAWFATRKCIASNGKMEYKSHSWNERSSEDWPTIYVFPLVKGLHTYLDLNSILSGSGAKRPERQQCGLLGGAGNLARNYCARYLGVKIRLGPGFKISNAYDAGDLFPSESEDDVLKHLKQTCLANVNRRFSLSELA
ncbi:hypothetical protein [Stutzerimonas azotifigens]|uniref:hypothetical protein n=1 Tax=Stutzerimonas azotifigens TaxID=291995 RepID=UPI000423A888|nr:hypothetical protein [Stutzerimonas azotifigens]